MANSPTRHVFEAQDGTRLAWHGLGDPGGRPVLLLHGLFSDSHTNWIKYGHAEALANRGFRLIMLDLRAHGSSEAPHDRSAYPPDILACDGLALARHLNLRDFDLGGYSLGARTAVRMVVMGAAPRRLIISGMGLDGLLSTGPRAEHFKHILTNIGRHQRGSSEWMAEAFLKTVGGDPKALLPLLDSFVDTPRDALERIATPTLILSGAQDQDNGSSRELADLLPDGCHVEVPGNHMSAVTRPELGLAMADFLAS